MDLNISAVEDMISVLCYIFFSCACQAGFFKSLESFLCCGCDRCCICAAFLIHNRSIDH